MPNSAPPLSIGLPVKNGAGFLAGALDSLLSQTYGDFDLLVADNDSDDSTGEIVRDYARRDPRVRYHRHAQDIGAAANFNYVFRATSGPLFKWAAADDLQHETFVQRCVAALDESPAAAAACTAIEHIDEDGASLGVTHDLRASDAAEPADRFADLIRYDYSCAVAFGVQRRALAERTRLLLPFWGSDRVFLAELALAGPLVLVGEPLFQEREHGAKLTTQVAQRRVSAFNRKTGYGSRFLTWRHAAELVRAVSRADLTPAQRQRVFSVLAKWAAANRVKFACSLARGVAETAIAPLTRA
ncbi:glycosyltransferase family 2 protein [Amycolatopsis benzoatilytica]|uniref:glycosyltransferase family 2 protein n=1 Tax=Amycolatopsis benzoatilytica TaxID=346045 RepID=UPI00039BAEFF|nr:glycosyltransferase [Amycolatopsis benzoatilytica]